MRSAHRPDLLKIYFDEIAIADFGAFQLAVPTTATPPEMALKTRCLVHSRQYDREGWVIYGDRIVGTLSELDIGQTPSSPGICPPIQRFGPAIPVGFEVCSDQPLPKAIGQLALFACFGHDARAPYCTVFRKVSPRFTRVYAVSSWQHFRVVDQVRRLLTEESQFIATNREHLRQVPFYRERFGL
ncbi:MAG: hypothetical protein AAGG53_11295 [Cyanobacteria bacterium P01_H01_bin.152]